MPDMFYEYYLNMSYLNRRVEWFTKTALINYFHVVRIKSLNIYVLIDRRMGLETAHYILLKWGPVSLLETY